MASRRRSAYVGFSVLTLSAAGLAGCGGGDQPKVYNSVAACKADHPGHACDDAWQASVGEHDKTAPRYTNEQACEAQYGPGHCEAREGGQVFMPLMAGFILGQMLNNNRCNTGAPYGNCGGYGGGGYFGHPVFYASGGGYRTPAINPGESVFTRSGGVSRGGFGATAGFRGALGGFRGG
ncbi:MAG TPA: DUF1190 domain-containing protein [Caulobacteraceae bacterium]|jgi:uncharacterized protein YgiB involved in biofilm formation|nr:DUF1190 domain-containing protein [Caulobacteraceae bacterium]